MAGQRPTTYRQHQQQQLEDDRKEFNQRKAAVRKLFQQLPLNSLFKQVTVKLLDLSYVDRICNPSLDFLGKVLSRHPKVIGRHTKAIEHIGLFTVERRKSKGKNLSNQYIINWDCKIWYLAKHPNYCESSGQAVVAKVREVIRKHTQTKLVASKRRGTVGTLPAGEPCNTLHAVAVEPCGYPEQEPYCSHQETVRFHKLPQERGRHDQWCVDVPEPKDLSSTSSKDVRKSVNQDAAAPHQYPLTGCEAAAQPQSSNRVLETLKPQEARDEQNVQEQSNQNPGIVLSLEAIERIRARIAAYDPGEDECDL